MNAKELADFVGPGYRLVLPTEEVLKSDSYSFTSGANGSDYDNERVIKYQDDWSFAMPSHYLGRLQPSLRAHGTTMGTNTFERIVRRKVT